MKGRRTAALLGVLFMHVALIEMLLRVQPRQDLSGQADSLKTGPITLYLQPPLEQTSAADELPASATLPSTVDAVPKRPEGRDELPAVAAPSDAIEIPGRVDWPIEGRKSAARVLAAEAEAERIAKMFSGPDGTWASLTPREKSRLRKFRWKRGVAGLEVDSSGNTIYHISEGCVLVNFMFIGCAIGKAKVHGDLFKDMRLYFDEQRMPPLDDGNGTER